MFQQLNYSVFSGGMHIKFKRGVKIAVSLTAWVCISNRAKSKSVRYVHLSIKQQSCQWGLWWRKWNQTWLWHNSWIEKEDFFQCGKKYKVDAKHPYRNSFQCYGGVSACTPPNKVPPHSTVIMIARLSAAKTELWFRAKTLFQYLPITLIRRPFRSKDTLQ